MRTAIIAIAIMVLLAAASNLVADQPQAGPDQSTVTMAVEYGLTKDKIASFDVKLCARLIRFGKVAAKRGRNVEAKRFFWQAVLVNPTSKLAWLYYDQAVIRTLADSVESMPSLIGLSGLEGCGPGAVPAEPPAPGAAPAKKPAPAPAPEDYEGC